MNPMTKTLFWHLGLGLMVLALSGFGGVTSAADHWLELKGDEITVAVGKDLALEVYRGPGEPVWSTRESSTPAVTVQIVKPDGKKTDANIRLGEAAGRKVEDYDDGLYKGHRIRLSELPGVDVEVELVLALGANDELLVQVEQVGGKNSVRRVAGLYDWKIQPAADSYMVVPRGSGYMIRSDSPKAARLGGFIGAAYSLPMFGIVAGNQTCQQIIDTWWDAKVSIDHTPRSGTVLSLDWEASLGKLRYPRRVFFRFVENMDHVGMAKAYRRRLVEQKRLITLAQRAEKTPALKRFLSGIEYRFVVWDDQDHQEVLDNIVRFQKAGLPVTFFHPKWLATPGWAQNSWQDFLKDKPREGGWAAAGKLIKEAHRLGCSVKLFVMPHTYYANGPAYDKAKLSGLGYPRISDRYAVEIVEKILDNLDDQGIQIDALYFDGHAAYLGHAEHQSPEGPVARKDSFEAQNDSFRETRRRGIVPGAELARFWCMGESDYFFFTDWSADRFRNGEPIPLFQLVFNDCYAAHFSGGGYYDEGKYDWYADRHPRLYELMYASMPSHNWLPGGSRPIKPEDWGTEAMNTRLKWLRLWHAYFQKVCYAEMLTHRFLNAERTLQRVEFAGGVVADFDLARGMYRVRGVPGFSGDWEKPPKISSSPLKK